MSKRKSNKHRQMLQRRKIGTRHARERFIIFCEGENTEVEYFKSFRLSSASVKTVHVNQGDAYSFVEAAIKVKSKYENYDQYWLVFDKDHTSNKRFNAALQKAAKNGFKTAYSNQAFEYWFLSHFEYLNCKISRKDYTARMEKYIGSKYSKTKYFCKQLYELLLPLQSKAIKNASLVYQKIGDHKNPALEESSTTVFKLVNELNKYLYQ